MGIMPDVKIQIGAENQLTGEPAQEFVDWASDSATVMSTFPRSGTNLIVFFMELLQLNYSDIEIDYKKLSRKPFAGWRGLLYEGLGLKYYVCGHLFCPGFELSFSKELAKDWKKLNPYHLMINDPNHSRLVEAFSEISYPHYNDKVRIVYVYRNPLDHLVSMVTHSENMVGTGSYLLNFNDPAFANKVANSYLRYYLTFREVKKQFPDNVFMMTYEKIKADMYSSLKEILSYIGVSTEGENEAKFAKTIELVQPENMKMIEKARGKTLAEDQLTGPNENNSHLRGGEVGKWKRHLNDEIVRIYEEKFKRFDVDLFGFDGVGS